MATKKKGIIDQIVTDLGNISGIGLVTQDVNEFASIDIGDFPAIFIWLEEPEVEPLSFPHSTANDMIARAVLNVEAATYSQYNTNSETDIDNLAQDIEQAIIGSSTLAGLVYDVFRTNSDKDIGQKKNYRIILQQYHIEYGYNHNTP